MARWSITDDRPVIERTETPNKFEHARIYIDLDLFSEAHGTVFEGDQDERVIKVTSNEVHQCSFDQFLVGFLKEIHNSFQPVPPLLGNGKPVDLKKLFLIVIGKGGYDAVSKNNLWNFVAELSGLGVNIGSSAKLIYCKYLGTLETWLIKVSEGRVLGYSLPDDGIYFGRQLMELQAKIKRLLSDYIAQDTGDKLSQIYDFKNEYDFLGRRKLFDANGVKSKVQHGGFLGLDMPSNLCNVDDRMTLNRSDGRKITARKLLNALGGGDSSDNNEVNNVISLSKGGKEFDNDHNDVLILDPSSVNKGNFGRKRKRKSMQEMLCWVTSIAKNPCDPIVCSVLERSKWSSQSNEEIKKQVLLFREAVFMKINVESSKQRDDWQGMKMHSSMYDDDQPGTTCNLKEGLKCCNSRRLPNEKFRSTVPVSPSKIPIPTEDNSTIKTQSPAEKASLLDLEKRNKITVPRGPAHQALVPEWTGTTLESDPKWLGNQIWPLETASHRLLIEENPMGKGRNDFCSCQVPGSMECVNSHIAENRAKVKSELGVAFYQWNLDKVGEDVSGYWTKEQEKKFKDALQSNSSSQKKCLWDRILVSFPKKSRQDLVNYYFNVFVLRRRRFQNRHSPDNIDSDDDRLELKPLIKPKAIGLVVRKK